MRAGNVSDRPSVPDIRLFFGGLGAVRPGTGKALYRSSAHIKAAENTKCLMLNSNHNPQHNACRPQINGAETDIFWPNRMLTLSTEGSMASAMASRNGSLMGGVATASVK
jgi:hypothetical protein